MSPRDALEMGASNGSSNEGDADRALWERDTKLESEFGYRDQSGAVAFTVFKGRRTDGRKAFLTGRRFDGGMSELDIARRNDPKDFYDFDGLKAVMRGAGAHPDLLYRWPEVLAAVANKPDAYVFITEGEKDADTLWARGQMATTNANGAGSWRSEQNRHFLGRRVVLLADNDPKGRERVQTVQPGLSRYARSVVVVELPGLRMNGDITDWLESGKTIDDLLNVVDATAATTGPRDSDQGVNLNDFYAFMPTHNYIFAPSGEAWPASSVNSRIPPVPLFDRNGAPVVDDNGEQIRLTANKWLDQHSPVEQMTWAPGNPQVISDRLISDGGWIHRPGCNVFNLYRPPTLNHGEAAKAQPWIDHVHRVYPGEAKHIVNWLAHRVQRPDEKINHALVLGGAQGIGKDTILEPVKMAIGPWNFAEVSPQHMIGRFNGFVKSVILRVSEARDLGDVDRFAFYDHMKAYTAAPPDVLRVDEKFLREYAVFNVCGVIITSNHKTNGIFLPEDDRRHYVAWSDLNKDDFDEGYWKSLWEWYHRGGSGHVAAYLAAKNLDGFQAKAPPPKTEAFWDIVASNCAPEDAELSDAIEQLGNPAAVTLSAVAEVAESSFGEWLKDRKNSRRVPHKMEECGYKSVRNPTSKSGRWKVDGKDVVIYVRKELSVRDAIVAAEKRVKEGNNVPF